MFILPKAGSGERRERKKMGETVAGMRGTRRDFLKAGVAAGVAAAVEVRAKAADGLLAGFTPETERLVPFPLSSVRLLAGICKDEAEINDRYLDSLNVDRLLHSFRLTAGITSNAKPYGGWEDPGCELRGHFAGGHFLSAVALSYAANGNTDLRSRGDALVAGLAACQKKIGNGYLSAFPAALLDHLAQDKPVWAPFYTYHKIMAGLLDMYTLAGNADAVAVAEGMARWAGDFFEGISDDQRQRMLRTEYGGMNESLVNLAALTKKNEYIDTAKLFEQPSILDPLAERRDELTGLHANTNVPKMIGAARMYEVTGERRYRRIAEYFLEEVLAARSYAIGNTSDDEHWTTAQGQLKGTLHWANAECCVAYNLMKLERLVFGWTADARCMDAYERQLWNCRLGTQNAQGLKQYFFPLASGYWRAYNSAEETFWCCTGTGVEEFAKFADTVYFRRGGDVYVNQFVASTLDWKEEGFAIRQETKFPSEAGTTLTITVARPAVRTIYLRIPSWTTGAAEVRVNGHALEAMAEPGSYLALKRTWQSGDRIQLALPMRLTEEALAGDATAAAALYGPLVLAADLGAGPADGPDKIIHGSGTTPKTIPPASALPKVRAADAKKAAGWIEPVAGSELRFKAAADGASLEVMPMYRVKEQRYSVYWEKSTS